MHIKTNLFEPTDEKRITEKKGLFSVLEYDRDMSVSPESAQEAYFSAQMNVRKRQLIAELEKNDGVYAQAGEMQLMIGDIDADTGLKNTGDLFRKVVSSLVTSESLLKPHYRGDGILVLEPTYRHILLEDMEDWPDGIEIEDGFFLACEDSVEMKVEGRKNISSMILGGEGLFNSVFYGRGVLAMESPVPRDELIEVELEDNTIRIDGNMAIAWSPGLDFRVEKSMGTLVGSAVSKEGFVNVYKGTGKVLIAPVRNNKNIKTPETKQN